MIKGSLLLASSWLRWSPGWCDGSLGSAVLILGFLLGRFQYLKGAHQRLVNRHHSSSVVEFSAIIGRGEKRDELPFGEELISVLDDLMSATNQVHVVTIQKLGHNVSAERERYSAIVFTPSLNVLVGVGPQQVTKQSRVGDVRRPHDAP